MKTSLSKTARAAGVLETTLEKSVLVGIRGMLVTVTIVVGYLIVGGLLTLSNSPLAPDPLLSIDGDPYFYTPITAVSVVIRLRHCTSPPPVRALGG